MTDDTYGNLGIGVTDWFGVGVYVEGNPGTDWSYTVATQVHGEGDFQLTQRFSVIGSTWEDGERVDIVHVDESGPGGRLQASPATPTDEDL